MAYDCNCKGISDIHTAQALAQAEARGETFKDADSLYAASLACKKADPKARLTGREDVNGCKFYKGCCRPVFEAAAIGGRSPSSSSSLKTIPVVSLDASGKTACLVIS